MNGILGGTVLAALSGIAFALAGCGGGNSSAPATGSGNSETLTRNAVSVTVTTPPGVLNRTWRRYSSSRMFQACNAASAGPGLSSDA